MTIGNNILNILFKTELLVVLFTFDILLAKLLFPQDTFILYVTVSLFGKGIIVFSELLSKLVGLLFSKTARNKKATAHFLLLSLFYGTLFVTSGTFATLTVPYLAIYLPYLITGLMIYSFISMLASYRFFGFFKKAATLFVPEKPTFTIDNNAYAGKKVAALIPTHMPSEMTCNLIESLVAYHPEMTVVVIDDATPVNETTAPVLSKINWLAHLYPQVVVLKIWRNTLKAGALNQGIDYLRALPVVPDVVFTFDDDVIVNKDTIPYMVNALYTDEKTGAVCSQVRISNKNKSILTRLQALEYHMFNVTKVADNGFVRGPLVMQGMLTAFRMQVLEEADGFSIGHLIEDYDITARTKVNGWKVRIAHKAIAWTAVPETVEQLWKQRARWTTGGLSVLLRFWKKLPVIYQDLIGHVTFLSMTALIIMSFIYAGSYKETAILSPILVGVALVTFTISLLYNVLILAEYPDRDIKDWVIKLSLMPELIYSNILSLILVGSYIFFVYNLVANFILWTITFMHKLNLSAFGRVGFTTTWGSRNI